MDERAAPYRLLLNVWKDATDHAPLEETMQRVAARIARASPADLLLVQRCDPGLTWLEVAAVERLRPCLLPSLSRRNLTALDRDALLAWSRAQGQALFRSGREDAMRGLAGPVDGFAEALAVPLGNRDSPTGILSLVARAPGSFATADEVLIAELAAPVSAALTNDAQAHEVARLREAFEADRRALLQRLGRDDLSEDIVGADSGLAEVMARVEQVAPTDVPVLLLGETGSGKEVVARSIHARSKRHAGPIVRVNCGAIPSGLIDSELFGHERGSFTGAVTSRRGWFERADGGTLFLDEVAELPLDAQVRLLRVLQDGTFERVGGQKTQSVDVRIIAATHRDVVDLVARGKLREDLWYRIGVFPIAIPALRERPEDVPALAAHFAARAGVRLGGAPLLLGPEDIDALVAYRWPGNVRELAAVIERAAILGDGRRLKVRAALGGGSGAGESVAASRPYPVQALPNDNDLSLDHAIARHVSHALRATRGRIEGAAGAAARLGINPHTLRARMRKLKIDWASYRTG